VAGDGLIIYNNMRGQRCVQAAQPQDGAHGLRHPEYARAERGCWRRMGAQAGRRLGRSSTVQSPLPVRVAKALPTPVEAALSHGAWAYYASQSGQFCPRQAVRNCRPEPNPTCKLSEPAKTGCSLLLSRGGQRRRRCSQQQ